MLWLWLTLGVIVALAVVVAFGWRPLRRLGGAIQVERARELFFLERERIESGFIAAAAATGKPRGLRWKDCSFDDEVEFARDRQSRQLIALVARHDSIRSRRWQRHGRTPGRRKLAERFGSVFF